MIFHPDVAHHMVRRGLSWAAAGCLAALAIAPATARADLDFTGKVEPGVTVPLTEPQSEEFGIGASQSLKVMVAVLPWLDVGPSTSFTILPSLRDDTGVGTAWTLGGGARLHWPNDSDAGFGISPWVDADALYVRTGPLDRPGFDVGVGFSIPFNAARSFRVGPFVRYLHVVQLDGTGPDDRNAQLLTVGISLEFGSGVKREPAPVVAEVVDPVTAAAPCAESCADGDADGVPDVVDRCPEVVGTIEGYGCPNYQKIVVRPDKLELKEKLFFAWDEAALEPASFPVLDEVVQALKDNKRFKVQVEGHTDSTGGDDHNQSLSERRAEAVLDYLATHGIARDRLVSKGFSSSQPTSSNSTVDGREDNRRVEFVVSFILLNKSSAP